MIKVFAGAGDDDDDCDYLMTFYAGGDDGDCIRDGIANFYNSNNQTDLFVWITPGVSLGLVNINQHKSAYFNYH